MVAEEEAIGRAVVVEAFGRWVEGELDVLAVVAVESWVVQVIREFRRLEVIRVEFRLGFRVEPRINLLFRKVVEDLVANKEVNITSRYESLERSNIVGDFQFIVMEKYLSQDNDLPVLERLMMKLHFWLKEISLSEERGFGLDASTVTIEKFPLIVAPVTNIKLKRLPSD